MSKAQHTLKSIYAPWSSCNTEKFLFLFHVMIIICHKSSRKSPFHGQPVKYAFFCSSRYDVPFLRGILSHSYRFTFTTFTYTQCIVLLDVIYFLVHNTNNNNIQRKQFCVYMPIHFDLYIYPPRTQQPMHRIRYMCVFDLWFNSITCCILSLYYFLLYR